MTSLAAGGRRLANSEVAGCLSRAPPRSVHDCFSYLWLSLVETTSLEFVKRYERIPVGSGGLFGDRIGLQWGNSKTENAQRPHSTS